MKIVLVDPPRIKLLRPRTVVTCVAFTATAALIASLIAAGVPVRHHITEPWQYVTPLTAVSKGHLWELLQDDRFKFIAVVTFLASPTGSLQTFGRPADWNDGNNKVEVIAGGGSGGVNSVQLNSSTGGGGGAYSLQNNVVIPGGGAKYQIGCGGGSVSTDPTSGHSGGDTWFNGTAVGASSVGAKGGSGGLYGGGGGAAGGNFSGAGTSGGGTQGLTVVTYVPIKIAGFNLAMMGM